MSILKLNVSCSLTITMQEQNPKREVKSSVLEQMKEEIPRLKKLVKKAPETVSNPLQHKGHVGFIAAITEKSEKSYSIYKDGADDGENSKEKIVPYRTIKLTVGCQTINCVAICGEKNLEVLDSVEKKSLVYITGIQIKIPETATKLKPAILITGIYAVEQMSYYLPYGKKVEQGAIEFLKGENLLKSIKKAVIKILGISSINDSPELSRALDLVILQAVSGGKIANTSGKIHALIIGAPANGKKLLADAAEILNVRFKSVSSSKLTIAGVSASTISKDGNWVSKPGAIPQAHDGVVSFQDFHNAPKAQMSSIWDVFSEVMENAKFTDSTTANKEHEATTAFLVDLNRQSDLSKVYIEDYQTDIFGIPTNILSRFDYITEIDANTERQMEIAISMYNRSGGLTLEERQEMTQTLRLSLARLRDEYQEIIIPGKVRKLLQRLHFELLDSERDELSAFQTRTTNAAIKLTTSIARLNKRTEASKEDAKLAFGFIQEKFRIVDKIHKSTISEKKLTGAKPTQAEILGWLIQTYGTKKVEVREAIEKYQEHFQADQTEDAIKRMLYRTLKKGGSRIKHGKYRLNLKQSSNCQNDTLTIQ